MPADQITSIDQLAAALEAQDAPEAEAEAQQDADNAQPEAEAQSDDQQGQQEAEGDQQQPVEGEGDQPAGESLDDKVVTWETAAGDKFEVPVSELKLGYMRQQHFTQETQNLAREREQAAQAIQQQYQNAQAYAKDLGTLQLVEQQIAVLEQAIPQMDRTNDPLGYSDAVAQLQMLDRHRTGLATRVQEVQQQRMAEQQQQHTQAQQKMLTELQTSLPGFGAELLGKLDKTALDYGYKPQEVQMVTDPRFVRVLHDAMQFRALQAKKPETVNKVKTAPVKPTKQAASAPSSGVEIHVKQFAAKKSLDNFARLLQHTL